MPPKTRLVAPRKRGQSLAPQQQSTVPPQVTSNSQETKDNVTTTVQVNEREPEFHPTFEKDQASQQTIEYQSITKMPNYQHVNFEQLRWRHYQKSTPKPKQEEEQVVQSAAARQELAPSLVIPTAVEPLKLLPLGSTATATASTVLLMGHEHSNSLFQDITKLQSDPVITGDVQLISSEGQTVPVHSLIIASRSPLFKSLLFDPNYVSSLSSSTPCGQGENNPHGIVMTNEKSITLSHISKNTLLTVVQWIYTDQTPNPQQLGLLEMQRLFEAACIMQMIPLQHLCIRELFLFDKREMIAMFWFWITRASNRFLREMERSVSDSFQQLVTQVEELVFDNLKAIADGGLVNDWDEQFVQNIYIPAAESWIVAPMKHDKLRDHANTILLKWARHHFSRNKEANEKRQFLTTLLDFKMFYLPEKWKKAFKELFSNDQLLLTQGVEILFSMLQAQ